MFIPYNVYSAFIGSNLNLTADGTNARVSVNLKNIFLLLLLFALAFTTNLYADTHPAADCEYATVNAAVAAADYGDTVTVPAGSCTWDSPLTITKAIILQGNGMDSTNITANYTNSSAGVVKYVPATPDAAHRFRITGFTLNTGNTHGVWFYQKTATAEYIRADHNRIVTSGSSRGFYVTGTFFGVIDNNVMTLSASAAGFYGNDETQWALARAFGSADNLYFEDNTIIITTSYNMISAGQGGRYVVRYNTMTVQGSATSIIDFHGNQPAGRIGADAGGNMATMVVEVYGNNWVKTAKGGIGSVVGQRGGWATVFFNLLTTNTTGNSNMYAREEYSDDLWPVGSYDQHATNSYYWGNYNTKTDGIYFITPTVLATENCCFDAAEAWQSDHVYGQDIVCKKFSGDSGGHCWKSYVTGSEAGTSGITEPDWDSVAPRYILHDGKIDWLNMGAGTPIVENKDIFFQKAGVFDGTGSTGGGVGCGPLASRPSTCITGVGYWATDQSCSDLTDMVGANPNTPISGTLYKCTAPSTWTAFYTPFTYPHPLRNSPREVAPPAGLKVLN